MCHLKVLWPLTLWDTQMKVATSPARMDPGPDRLTLLVGSGERDCVHVHVHDIPHVSSHATRRLSLVTASRDWLLLSARHSNKEP